MSVARNAIFFPCSSFAIDPPFSVFERRVPGSGDRVTRSARGRALPGLAPLRFAVRYPPTVGRRRRDYGGSVSGPAAAPAQTPNRTEQEPGDDRDHADCHQNPPDRRHDGEPQDQADDEQQNSKTYHNYFLLSLQGENVDRPDLVTRSGR